MVSHRFSWPELRELRLIIPFIALVLIIIRIIWPGLQIDTITIGLLAVAFLPWFSTLLESFKLPGGYEVNFREIEKKQQIQQTEIDTLKFLVSHFVTKYELEHLKKLADSEPFLFDKTDSFPFFIDELQRLFSLRLIQDVPDSKGLIGLREQERGDVKVYFIITKNGLDYLKVLHQLG